MAEDHQHDQQHPQRLLGMAAMTAAAEAHAASLALFPTPPPPPVGSSSHYGTPALDSYRSSSAPSGATSTSMSPTASSHHRGLFSALLFSTSPSGSGVQGSGLNQEEERQQEEQADVLSSTADGDAGNAGAAIKGKRRKRSAGGKQRQCQVSRHACMKILAHGLCTRFHRAADVRLLCRVIFT